MKRLLSIIMLIVCVLAKADAQYYSVNYDRQTVAAMAAAYGTEAVAEAYYNEQVQNILKHYNAAEVASAGIYAIAYREIKVALIFGKCFRHYSILQIINIERLFSHQHINRAKYAPTYFRCKLNVGQCFFLRCHRLSITNFLFAFA